jgi:hypothetical protein
VADGVRLYLFNNPGAGWCDILAFALAAAGTGVFTLGAVIDTGNVLATSYTGVNIATTPGMYYALENAGGPWSSPGQYTGVTWHVNTNGSANPAGYPTGGQAWPGGSPPDWIMRNDTIAGGYNRIYFLATAAAVQMSVAGSTDNPAGWPNYTGSLDYILYNASYAVGDKRVTIRSINVYNICEGV